jgi:hypothetical protein
LVHPVPDFLHEFERDGLHARGVSGVTVSVVSNSRGGSRRT